MKPYGVKRKDRGCCPGHDKYSKGYTNTKRDLYNENKGAKHHARQLAKKEIQKELS